MIQQSRVEEVGIQTGVRLEQGPEAGRQAAERGGQDFPGVHPRELFPGFSEVLQGMDRPPQSPVQARHGTKCKVKKWKVPRIPRRGRKAAMGG